MSKEKMVKRAGSKITLCLCPACKSWHIKGKRDLLSSKDCKRSDDELERLAALLQKGE